MCVKACLEESWSAGSTLLLLQLHAGVLSNNLFMEPNLSIMENCSREWRGNAEGSGVTNY